MHLIECTVHKTVCCCNATLILYYFDFRRFIGINPDRGTKAKRGKVVSKRTGVIVQKKSATVNTHVAMLLKNLADFEWNFIQIGELYNLALSFDSLALPHAQENWYYLHMHQFRVYCAFLILQFMYYCDYDCCCCYDIGNTGIILQ